MTVVHNDMHTRAQFLHFCMLVRFRFRFVHLFMFFVFCVFIHDSLGHFVWLTFFFVLGLVSSVLSQEIGYEERLRNDLFCVKWDIKP